MVYALMPEFQFIGMSGSGPINGNNFKIVTDLFALLSEGY